MIAVWVDAGGLKKEPLGLYFYIFPARQFTEEPVNSTRGMGGRTESSVLHLVSPVQLDIANPKLCTQSSSTASWDISVEVKAVMHSFIDTTHVIRRNNGINIIQLSSIFLPNPCSLFLCSSSPTQLQPTINSQLTQVQSNISLRLAILDIAPTTRDPILPHNKRTTRVRRG